jgi:hypothetical protein
MESAKRDSIFVARKLRLPVETPALYVAGLYEWKATAIMI